MSKIKDAYVGEYSKYGKPTKSLPIREEIKLQVETAGGMTTKIQELCTWLVWGDQDGWIDDKLVGGTK